MKTVFDKATRDELISRINALNENSKAGWGRMNLYQAVKHCSLWDEWMQSDKENKQAFVGRLFGKIALKKVLNNEAPLARNTPTLAEFRIKETAGDIAFEKNKWATQMAEYAHFSHPIVFHTFFGKITKEQAGQLAYKHADHHLRQFNG
jgi:hypothetical protein